MNPLTKQLLEEHCNTIDKLNNQRRHWLYASSVVFTGIILLIFSWNWLDNLHSQTIWWVVISLMLILSINWWYWTMRVVKILLCHQQVVHDLLHSVLDDIAHAKTEIKNLVTNNVDTET